MRLFLKISSQLFCLLLMIHLLARNAQIEFNLRLLNPIQLSKDFDFEEENGSIENKTESKSAEKDISSGEFDDSTPNLYQTNKKNNQKTTLVNIKKFNFQFLENSFPIVHFEIQGPPPRA